jgi:3-hydroxyisobutyrate dehydrogenase-like beta-hydroxyacid dehydrogenase
MSTIAFIGLGIMGGPMAEHLVKAGHTVIGFNRSPGPVERLVAAGGKGATGVAEAVREADAIITMVPDSPDVEGLAFGEDGILRQRPARSDPRRHVLDQDRRLRASGGGRQGGRRSSDGRPGERR